MAHARLTRVRGLEWRASRTRRPRIARRAVSTISDKWHVRVTFSNQHRMLTTDRWQQHLTSATPISERGTTERVRQGEESGLLRICCVRKGDIGDVGTGVAYYCCRGISNGAGQPTRQHETFFITLRCTVHTSGLRTVIGRIIAPIASLVRWFTACCAGAPGQHPRTQQTPRRCAALFRCRCDQRFDRAHRFVILR